MILSPESGHMGLTVDFLFVLSKRALHSASADITSGSQPFCIVESVLPASFSDFPYFLFVRVPEMMDRRQGEKELRVAIWDKEFWPQEFTQAYLE